MSGEFETEVSDYFTAMRWVSTTLINTYTWENIFMDYFIVLLNPSIFIKSTQRMYIKPMTWFWGTQTQAE